MELSAKLDLRTILTSANLAESLKESDRKEIGRAVWAEWDIDRKSRSEWDTRMSFGLELALQVIKNKTFPWPGASNVKFPLVTIAALQYQARAYPALIPSPEVVRCRVFGEDPQGELDAAARRIANHMSYQVLEEDESWEADEDSALIAQALFGSAFKKTFFSPSLGHNVSEHVFAKDLYISYFAKSLAVAPRLTQVLHFSKNDMESRRRSGLFLDWDEPDTETRPAVQAPEVLDEGVDSREGITRPSDDPAYPYTVLEQHRWLDLDGDGFEEPYVVFIREDTQKLLRVVARFCESNVRKNPEGKIYHIQADQYYTQRIFIPSPDGGIYGLGFIALLGPVNESINTGFNLLLDAGTVANTAGGFFGRGVKFRSGVHTVKPWEWMRVDSTGDDLRKGIVPLPVREPSTVVLGVLKLLIDYGERIGMATDPQVGVPTGQNTPAETSRNMIQEGQRVFSSIYKRTRRALKEEFRKLYCLNRTYLQDKQTYVSEAATKSAEIFRADYSMDEQVIVPAADPDMVSDAERLRQAMLLKQAAMATPGYNRYEVEKKFLRCIKVTDIDTIFPDPKGPNAVPPPPNPKVAVEMMKLEGAKLKLQMEMQFKIAKLMQDAELNRGKLLELEARSAKEFAEADGIPMGHQIAAMDAMIAAAKAKQEGLFNSMNMLKEMYQSLKEGESQHDQSGGVQGMGQPPGHEGVPAVSGGPAGGGQGAMGAGGVPA
jgi:chaperonin GroES